MCSSLSHLDRSVPRRCFQWGLLPRWLLLPASLKKSVNWSCKRHLCPTYRQEEIQNSCPCFKVVVPHLWIGQNVSDKVGEVLLFSQREIVVRCRYLGLLECIDLSFQSFDDVALLAEEFVGYTSLLFFAWAQYCNLMLLFFNFNLLWYKHTHEWSVIETEQVDIQKCTTHLNCFQFFFQLEVQIINVRQLRVGEIQLAS